MTGVSEQKLQRMSHEGELTPLFTFAKEYEPHLERLNAAMDISDQDRTLISDIVDQAAARVRGSLLSPEPTHESTIQTVAGMYKWAMLGRLHDPLPDGIVAVLYSYPKPRGEISISALPRYRSISLGRSLLNAGIGQAIAYHRQLMNDREPRLHEAAEIYLRDSSAYRFLHSFEQSSPTDAQRPLSDYWRQVREAQTEQEIRTKYGMDQGAVFMPGSNARRELGRRILQIDDEVQPRSNERQLDSMQALRLYVTQQLRDKVKNDGHEFIAIVGNDGLRVRTADGTVKELDLNEALSDLAFGAESGVLDPDAPLRKIEEYLLAEAYMSVFDSKSRDTYRDLNGLIEHSVVEALKGLANLNRVETDTDINYLFGDMDQMITLRQPTTGLGVLDANDYQEIEDTLPRSDESYWDRLVQGARPGVVSKEISERLKQERFAIVGRFESTEDPEPMRLIVSGIADRLPGRYDMPTRYVEGDIEMFINYETYPNRYDIPGYQLRGYVQKGRGYEYIYEKSRDKDPYALCEVSLSDSQLAVLITTYRRLGLDTTMLLSSDKAPLTVYDLVEYLRSQSEYVTSDHPMAERAKFGLDYMNSTRVDMLDMFKNSVQDGRLYAQCTGAAELLSISLNIAFGDGSARTITGNVMERESAIVKGSRHTQTIFYYNGEQYILDATPTGFNSSNVNDAVNAGSTGLRREMASSYESSDIDTTRESEDESYANDLSDDELLQDVAKVEVTESTDERVADLVKGLTSFLKVRMDARSDNQLYEALLKLPENDPMRVTMQVIKSIESGNASRRTPQQLLAYLQAVLAADKAQRNRAGFDKYVDSVLDQLIKTTARYIELRSE